MGHVPISSNFHPSGCRRATWQTERRAGAESPYLAKFPNTGMLRFSQHDGFPGFFSNSIIRAERGFETASKRKIDDQEAEGALSLHAMDVQERNRFEGFRKRRRSKKLGMNQVGENFETLHNPRPRTSEEMRTIRSIDPA